MAKGVIYIMTSIVDGLIKIGKTQTKQFEARMGELERNGYRNVTGLKRYFAIEVDGYDEKETLLHNIFEKSRVPNTELFAMDINLAMQLLLAFEGRQVYPKSSQVSKEELFEEATGVIESRAIPDGEYYLDKKIKRLNNKTISAVMRVENGHITVLKGSQISSVEGVGIRPYIIRKRNTAKIKDGILQKNEEFSSVSNASSFVTGAASNGWLDWKITKNGKESIDTYREHEGDCE